MAHMLFFNRGSYYGGDVQPRGSNSGSYSGASWPRDLLQRSLSPAKHRPQMPGNAHDRLEPTAPYLSKSPVLPVHPPALNLLAKQSSTKGYPELRWALFWVRRVWLGVVWGSMNLGVHGT